MAPYLLFHRVLFLLLPHTTDALPLRPPNGMDIAHEYITSSARKNNITRYGSTYNPNARYPIPPPTGQQRATTATTAIDDEDDFPLHLLVAARNEYDGAMEDFTNIDNRRDDEARIYPPASARHFADAALVSDPIKVKWHNLHQLNECHPSLVKVPTMVVSVVFPLLLPPPPPPVRALPVCIRPCVERPPI